MRRNTNFINNGEAQRTMAKNDIYNNKGSYDTFLLNYEKELLINPTETGIGKRKYYCLNKDNLLYVQKLINRLEARDTSYIRRNKLISEFKVILNATPKDLKSLNQEDMDNVVIYMRKNYPNPRSQSDFIKDLKTIWRWLFPETDNQGRPDNSIVPYAVRHLSAKIDKSREVERGDKLYLHQFKKLVSYFSNDKMMQAYLTLAAESLARPQELLYLRNKNIEFNDNYAKITLSEHGKEGTGILQCFDSYPYVLAWKQIHPLKNDPNAFFFLNNKHSQARPESLNKRIRKAEAILNIPHITNYSLKRNGVTFDLLAGKRPQTIQHKARWTSLKQLSTYSKMTQEDNFNIEGIKKGRITDKKLIAKYEGLIGVNDEREAKKCVICGHIAGFEDEICDNCKRPLDREKIREQIEQRDTLANEVQELKKLVEKHEDRITYLIDNLVLYNPDSKAQQHS